MPVTQPGPSPASSADFQRILRALGRNWRFIALCAALTMGTFFLLLLGQPFVYRASTTLVAHNKQGLGDLSNLAATLAPGLLPPAQTGPNLMTELDVIQSRTVLDRVADELHLQVAVMDHARIETLGAVLARKLQALSRPVEETPDEDLQARRPPMTFADASVPAHRDEARWTLTRTGETTFEVVDDERNTALGQGTIGSPFSAADVSFTVAEIVGKVGDTYGLELKTRERAIDDLQEAVVARRPKDRSDVLLVEVSDQSPVVAKTLANAVANAYLAQTMDWKNDMAQSHDEFLREQIATAERNLADAQEALNTYRAQADTVSLSEETRGLIGVLTEAKLNLATQQMTVQQLQYAYDRLKKASPRDFLVLINGTMAEVPIQAGMVSELSGLITQ
ncbi:MAG TPA: Wzz/FepE/Etk N-terminal domain-containing protein, partial [bacterium]|nr:Wzz/FepE/Etk N-terminal domain-containing protein [bacterium]